MSGVEIYDNCVWKDVMLFNILNVFPALDFLKLVCFCNLCQNVGGPSHHRRLFKTYNLISFDLNEEYITFIPANKTCV